MISSSLRLGDVCFVSHLHNDMSIVQHQEACEQLGRVNSSITATIALTTRFAQVQVKTGREK